MVKAPDKELRFTRSGQTTGFGLMGAMSFAVGVTLLATSTCRDVNPDLPHGFWSVPFFILAFGFVWLARHLVKHAYLILTPLGLEIFPFFFPSKNLHLVLWQEITAAEVSEDGKWLTLHFNEEKSAGLHLSLRPVSRKLRSLLAKAVLGRVSPRDA
jgi:hypothetical protein